MTDSNDSRTAKQMRQDENRLMQQAATRVNNKKEAVRRARAYMYAESSRQS